MATLTTPPVLYEEGVKSLAEIMFHEIYNDPELTSIFNVKTGIVNKKQIGIMDKNMTGLMGKVKDACDTTAANISYTGSTKRWTTSPVSDRISQCWDTFRGTFIEYGFGKGLSAENLVDNKTAWSAFMSEVTPNAILMVLYRIAWFGDTAIVEGTNNSLTGSQGDYFNMLDGIWKQIYAIVAADATKRSTSTQTAVITALNAQATFSGQAFTSTHVTNQVVTGALDEGYYEADVRLTSLPKSELAWYVTRSMGNQYEKERKKVVAGVPLSYSRTESGIDVLQNNGIDVIPVNFWDRTMRTYFGQDATNVATYRPHRAILTTKSSNLMIGTTDNAGLGDFEMFYDKVGKNNIIDWLMQIDVKVGLDELVQVIY